MNEKNKENFQERLNKLETEDLCKDERDYHQECRLDYIEEIITQLEKDIKDLKELNIFKLNQNSKRTKYD